MDITAINRDFRYYTLLSQEPHRFAPASDRKKLDECGNCPWGVIQQLHRLKTVTNDPTGFDGQEYAAPDGTPVFFNAETDEWTLTRPTLDTE